MRKLAGEFFRHDRWFSPEASDAAFRRQQEAAQAAKRIDRVSDWLFEGGAIPQEVQHRLTEAGVGQVIDLREQIADAPRQSAMTTLNRACQLRMPICAERRKRRRIRHDRLLGWLMLAPVAWRSMVVVRCRLVLIASAC
jgi:hypothetical protein